jgi:cyclohexyl-isocyanide hydratase
MSTLRIGALVFPRLDQLDFTGPFEVLSRVPGSEFHVLWKERTPVVDLKGLVLTPTTTFDEAPPLDVLVVPGGWGQQALMEDESVLSFVKDSAARAACVLSVCTGALVLGAAGLLVGKRATTHWASFHLLPYFGAIPVQKRVVVDGSLVTTAGVTAGIDGALAAVARLRGERAAQEIQLYMEYAPEPPLPGGTPESSPKEMVAAFRESARAIGEERLATARAAAARLGVVSPAALPPRGA